MTTCDGCAGNGGWYTDPNGDRYLSDLDGSMQETWQKCQECNGTGKIDNGGVLIGFPTLGELMDKEKTS